MEACFLSIIYNKVKKITYDSSASQFLDFVSKFYLIFKTELHTTVAITAAFAFFPVLSSVFYKK